MLTYKRALTIAGSDSGGGAGIQADLKTFGALGCYGMSVITAITAQNTTTVSKIHPVPSDVVEAQLKAVLLDIGTDAVKIGMVDSSEIIKIVAGCLQSHRVKNIVLDTVMLSKSGNKLLQDEAIEALKKYLIPISDIITPNLPEAEVLIQSKIETIAEMRIAVKKLADLGSAAILLKGGHLNSTESVDLFYYNGEIIELPFRKINTENTHGTGCTLSSAIAVYLAKGLTLTESVFQAKDFITSALEAGKNYKLGQGHGPVHHFYKFWQ